MRPRVSFEATIGRYVLDIFDSKTFTMLKILRVLFSFANPKEVSSSKTELVARYLQIVASSHLLIIDGALRVGSILTPVSIRLEGVTFSIPNLYGLLGLLGTRDDA